MTKKSAPKSLSEKIARIEEIASWFESDEFEIDKAIELFEEGSILLVEIKKDLGDKKLKIEKIKSSTQ